MPTQISWQEYRRLKPRDLLSPRYRHLLLLLFWPLELLLFELTERIAPTYRPIFCALDQQLPLCGAFVLPYLLWFLTWTGTLLYLLLRDVPCFRRTMWYMIGTILPCLCIFALWPSQFPLRPQAAPAGKLWTLPLDLIYRLDRNTDTFPSLHVVVALGSVFAVWHARGISRPVAAALTVHGLLICASVALIKQHSVLDIAGALAVAVPGYLLCFLPRRFPLWAGEAADPGS